MSRKYARIVFATVILATTLLIALPQIRCSSTSLDEAQLVLSEARAELVNAKLGYQLLLEDADSVLKNPKEWLVTTYPANKIENAILTAEQQLKISDEAINTARAMLLVNKTFDQDVILLALKARYKSSEARAFVADSYSQLWLSALQNVYNDNQALLNQNEAKEISSYLDDSKTLRREADVIAIAYVEDSLYLRKSISDLDIKNQRYLSSANKAHIGFQKLQNLVADRSEKNSLYMVLGFTLTPVIVGYSGLTGFLYRRLRQAKKKIEQYEKEKEDAKTIETATKIGKAVVRF